jgi:hypothetical protein
MLCFAAVLVNLHQTALCHSPEECSLHSHVTVMRVSPIQTFEVIGCQVLRTHNIVMNIIMYRSEQFVDHVSLLQ